MSFGFLGIQMGFALQIGNTTRIFQTLDVDIESIPIFWLAGPVTGFVVQPIIGYLSDRTWSPKWGRRRPFFLIGAIMAFVALMIMPNSGVWWMALGMLWLMDTSFNVAMEPFRAFVGDKLPSEQRTTGFTMQSFFIGTGAVIASLLPYMLTNWFGVDNIGLEGEIGDSVKWSFYIGAIAFLLAVSWTVFRTKEYPPEDLEAFEKEKKETSGIINAFVAIFTGLFQMPKTMMQLAAVQFFSWLALFAMWIYTTPVVAEQIFGSGDASTQAYQDGADWVGVCFAVYNGVAALSAFLIPVVAKKISRRSAHMVALFCGALGLISIYFAQTPTHVVMSMVGVGIAWASILSMPYAMLMGSLPANKLGYFVGVFNFFIVIPQILAAGILGWVLKTFFQNLSIYALVIGGISFAIAAVLCLLITDEDDPVLLARR